MSRFWKHVPPTVRPRSARGIPLLLCLLVFGLSAIVVYRWGHQRWVPTNPNPTYTATAYVVQRPHKVRIPLAYTDDEPRRAEEVANLLAERYVCDRRADWKRRTEGPCLKAREATETARREHVLSEARLGAFRRQLAEAAAKPQAAVERREISPPPPMIDNPQWFELDRKLAELERRHDNLLMDRTPLHPAVQDVAVRIEDLKRRMASIPRQIPGNLPSPDQPSVGARRGAGGEGNQEKLDELTAAVEKARRACDAAEAAEKQALQEQQAGPQYAVENAQVVEIPPTPDYAWWRLICMTLVTGTMMAFGVGCVSDGVNIEPPLASVGEVRTGANLPVIGTIPADDPVPDPPALSRRQSRQRRTLIAVGLILLAVGPVMAIWGVIGI